MKYVLADLFICLQFYNLNKLESDRLIKNKNSSFELFIAADRIENVIASVTTEEPDDGYTSSGYMIDHLPFRRCGQYKV